MNPRKYNNLKRPGVVTTSFGGKTRGEANHPGVDFANKGGTPVQALANGVVTSTGQTRNGMGNVVTLKDEEGNTHYYSHLQGANVKPGRRVKKGEQIARMGKSGNVYSPTNSDPTHLDVRIVSAFGKYQNPMTYF